MALPITAAYAGVLALIVVALGINVTVHRAKFKIALGDGGNPAMFRMIRVHGNAIEYIPMALLLMAIYEINGGYPVALHIAGLVLLAGRISQSWGMWSTEEGNFFRAAGQSATWLTMAALALLNLAKVI